MNNPHRNYQGRYDHGDMDAMCDCGHVLGVHAADNETGKRPCFNEDTGMEGTTGTYCDCPHFKKAQSTSLRESAKSVVPRLGTHCDASH